MENKTSTNNENGNDANRLLAEVVLVSLTLISWFGISKVGRKTELEKTTQNIGNLKQNTMVCGCHSISANGLQIGGRFN